MAVFYGSFGSLLFKMGADRLVFKIKDLIRNWRLILGLFIYGTSTFPFIFALRGGELSVLYPMVATVYLWVSLWSIKFLKEKMSLTKWMGVALIIIGVIFVGLGS
jgi:uncharacterized membrane protein